MNQEHHSIKTVARRTGLSPHVIRIWEKRYSAVTPGRTTTNRRIYSDEQIERLNLLREVTRAGHNIGAVAKFSAAKLKTMTAENERRIEVRTVDPAKILKACIQAISSLDAPALEGALKEGAVELGGQGLLQNVVAPLTQKIGELWCNGTITAAHEHFASAVIRVFLGQAANSFASTGKDPVLVVATPSGQLHEMGALLAGAAAGNLGWNVTYVGPGLPAAEIVGAAKQSKARAVALSLVYPEDDPRVESELIRLRELLPKQVALLVGGRAASAYENVLAKIGAIHIKDLAHMGVALGDLRKHALK